MNKYRVCHISTVHPLYDDRIFYKECISLAGNLYEVYLVVSHTEDELIQDVNILSIPFPKNRTERLLKNSFLAFKRALKIHPNIIHLHDPELIGLGIIFRLLGKKVIYDVHEDVPKQIRYKKWLGSSLLRYLISKVIGLIESTSTLFFNRIIVVTEDIKKKFPVSKTILLRNFPRLDMIRNSVPPDLEKKNKVVMYVGNLSEIRGIKEVIDATEFVKAELWLLGEWENKEYEAYCKASAGWKKTSYFGKKRLDEVYGYLKLADIGIALLYPSKNYLTSLPVKAFEYMALGIPMVVSDFPYWREIFSGSAEFANPYKPDEIAEKLNMLITNDLLCKQLSKYSVNLIKNKYSWETESEKLITLYKELLNEN